MSKVKVAKDRTHEKEVLHLMKCVTIQREKIRELEAQLHGEKQSTISLANQHRIKEDQLGVKYQKKSQRMVDRDHRIAKALCEVVGHYYNCGRCSDGFTRCSVCRVEKE